MANAINGVAAPTHEYTANVLQRRYDDAKYFKQNATNIRTEGKEAFAKDSQRITSKGFENVRDTSVNNIKSGEQIVKDGFESVFKAADDWAYEYVNDANRST